MDDDAMERGRYTAATVLFFLWAGAALYMSFVLDKWASGGYFQENLRWQVLTWKFVPPVVMLVVFLKKCNIRWYVAPIAVSFLLTIVVGSRVSYRLFRVGVVDFGGRSIFSGERIFLPSLIIEFVFIILQIVFLFKRKGIFAVCSLAPAFLFLLIGFWEGYGYKGFLLDGSAETFLMMVTYIFLDRAILDPQPKKRKTEPQEFTASVAPVTYQMFCPACGERFPAGRRFCNQCGVELKMLTRPENAAQPYVVQEKDESSFGWALLGFLIPMLGLIFYLSWKDTMPLRARSIGKGALIGVIAYVLFVALCVGGYIAIMASLRGY